MQYYRIIVADTPDHLEAKVNGFLGGTYEWKVLGPPQVFGHNEYVQAFIKREFLS